MAKWPDVPHCYGWLGLDARGNWYMRDDATQAAGPFAQSKGSLLQHDKLIDFIGRNYASDEQGGGIFKTARSAFSLNWSPPPTLLASPRTNGCGPTMVCPWNPNRLGSMKRGCCICPPHSTSPAFTLRTCGLHWIGWRPKICNQKQQGQLSCPCCSILCPVPFRDVDHLAAAGRCGSANLAPLALAM